jgi:hypothetical protein
LVTGDLMPMEPGKHWTYEVQEDDSEPKLVTWTVASIAKSDEGVEATIEISQAGTVLEKQVWRKSPTGIYLLSGGTKGTENHPAFPIVATPVHKGDKLEHKGIGLLPNSREGRIAMVGEVLGLQKIETANGITEAVAIEDHCTYHATMGEVKGVLTYWFKPGVGLVRYRMELEGFGATTMRLKETNVK